MSKNFLNEIVNYKQSLLEEKKVFFSSLKNRLSGDEHRRYRIFHRAISQPKELNLIAEVKKASPSAGILREDFDLLKIADTYVKEGAAAISVLTEDKYFLGKQDYLKKIANHCKVPVLMKDFVIDEGQIYEARFNGASAVLLIVAILNDEQLQHMMTTAGSLDLDCLVEVHDEIELNRAIEAGADIIGINNRNLETLDVDLSTCDQLIPKIPEDKVIVAESGFKTHEDIIRIKNLGAHAVLIGESFMKEKDIAQAVRKLMHG